MISRKIPNNLTGLIAFISDHENPLGELYTFQSSHEGRDPSDEFHRDLH